jgi:hypothetical protein
METHDQLEQWVNQRMVAAPDPADWPDTATGWRRLDQRIARRTPRVRLWAAATVAVCTAVLALPPSRAVAQRFWDQVVLGRIQVLVSDSEYHGAAVSVFSTDMQLRLDSRRVASLEEATRAAGFVPHLLRGDVVSSAPTYSVTDVAAATLPLRTSDIRQLVARAGGSASEVPDSWNGVVLEVRAGPVVIADYNGILLLQSRPFQLIKPVDFDLERFYRLAFRTLGMSERDAGVLGADLSISPALLMLMPKEDRERLQEFKTRSGTGTMIAEVYGAGKVAALWSGADRVYALFGNVNKDFVVRVANALD